MTRIYKVKKVPEYVRQAFQKHYGEKAIDFDFYHYKGVDGKCWGAYAYAVDGLLGYMYQPYDHEIKSQT